MRVRNKSKYTFVAMKVCKTVEGFQTNLWNLHLRHLFHFIECFVCFTSFIYLFMQPTTCRAIEINLSVFLIKPWVVSRLVSRGCLF